MSFFDSIKAYWRNYANFNGRTSRTTFWWTILFLVLASAAVSLIFPGNYIEETIFGHFDVVDYKESAMENLWALGTILPSIAMTVRRLHDMGRPGTHFWFLLIPIAGPIMLLIWCLKPSVAEANAYGEPVQ